MLKRFIKRIFCRHLYTTKDPIEVTETWSYVYECGKCGHQTDVTRQVVIGKIPRETPPDAFDLMIARKRATGTTEST